MPRESAASTITRLPWGRRCIKASPQASGPHPGRSCQQLGISGNRLNELVLGKRRVTADTALRLSRPFGTTPQLWMHLRGGLGSPRGDESRLRGLKAIGSGMAAARLHGRPGYGRLVTATSVCLWCLGEVTMSRMTVTIDDELLERAKEALGAQTRAAAIRTALEEAVRRRRLAEALEQRGQLELRGDLAELRRLREEG